MGGIDSSSTRSCSSNTRSRSHDISWRKKLSSSINSNSSNSSSIESCTSVSCSHIYTYHDHRSVSSTSSSNRHRSQSHRHFYDNRSSITSSSGSNRSCSSSSSNKQSYSCHSSFSDSSSSGNNWTARKRRSSTGSSTRTITTATGSPYSTCNCDRKVNSSSSREKGSRTPHGSGAHTQHEGCRSEIASCRSFRCSCQIATHCSVNISRSSCASARECANDTMKDWRFLNKRRSNSSSRRKGKGTTNGADIQEHDNRCCSSSISNVAAVGSNCNSSIRRSRSNSSNEATHEDSSSSSSDKLASSCCPGINSRSSSSDSNSKRACDKSTSNRGSNSNKSGLLPGYSIIPKNNIKTPTNSTLLNCQKSCCSSSYSSSGSNGSHSSSISSKSSNSSSSRSSSRSGSNSSSNGSSSNSSSSNGSGSSNSNSISSSSSSTNSNESGSSSSSTNSNESSSSSNGSTNSNESSSSNSTSNSSNKSSSRNSDSSSSGSAGREMPERASRVEAVVFSESHATHCEPLRLGGDTTTPLKDNRNSIINCSNGTPMRCSSRRDSSINTIDDDDRYCSKSNSITEDHNSSSCNLNRTTEAQDHSDISDSKHSGRYSKNSSTSGLKKSGEFSNSSTTGVNVSDPSSSTSTKARGVACDDYRGTSSRTAGIECCGHSNSSSSRNSSSNTACVTVGGYSSSIIRSTSHLERCGHSNSSSTSSSSCCISSIECCGHSDSNIGDVECDCHSRSSSSICINIGGCHYNSTTCVSAAGHSSSSSSSTSNSSRSICVTCGGHSNNSSSDSSCTTCVTGGGHSSRSSTSSISSSTSDVDGGVYPNNGTNSELRNASDECVSRHSSSGYSSSSSGTGIRSSTNTSSTSNNRQEESNNSQDYESSEEETSRLHHHHYQRHHPRCLPRNICKENCSTSTPSINKTKESEQSCFSTHSTHSYSNKKSENSCMWRHIVHSEESDMRGEELFCKHSTRNPDSNNRSEDSFCRRSTHSTSNKGNTGSFWKRIGSPKFVLGPMVDASELPFRLLTRRFGVDLAYTPMLHSRLFVEDPKYRATQWQVLPRCGASITSDECDCSLCKNYMCDRPLFAQFCGDSPTTLLEAAKLVQHEVDAVDINLGCPQGIARRGHYGAFLLDEPELIVEIISTLARNLEVPVTCKLRKTSPRKTVTAGKLSASSVAGKRSPSILRQLQKEEQQIQDTLHICYRLQEAGCAALCIHGRTKEQKAAAVSAVDWHIIKLVKQRLHVPVIANGGVETYNDALSCLGYTGADAVMSAEGLLDNPLLFFPAAMGRAASPLSSSAAVENSETFPAACFSELDIVLASNSPFSAPTAATKISHTVGAALSSLADDSVAKESAAAALPTNVYSDVSRCSNPPYQHSRHMLPRHMMPLASCYTSSSLSYRPQQEAFFPCEATRCSLMQEYLQLCKHFPSPHTSCAKSHIFRCLYPILIKHIDLRQALSEASTLSEFQTIVEQAEERARAHCSCRVSYNTCCLSQRHRGPDGTSNIVASREDVMESRDVYARATANCFAVHNARVKHTSQRRFVHYAVPTAATAGSTAAATSVTTTPQPPKAAATCEVTRACAAPRTWYRRYRRKSSTGLTAREEPSEDRKKRQDFFDREGEDETEGVLTLPAVFAA